MYRVVQRGAPLVFNVVVRNTGEEFAEGAFAEVQLPAGVTFDPDNTDSGWELVPDTENTYRFPLGQLLANASDGLPPIVTTVNNDLEDGASLEAALTVGADNVDLLAIVADAGDNIRSIVEGDVIPTDPTDLPGQNEPDGGLKIFLPIIGN